MNLTLKVIAIVILNFIPSVIIPAIFDYYQWLSRSEAILMAVLLWVLLNSGMILYRANELGEKELQRHALMNIENQFDSKLANIQQNYRSLLQSARDEPDLFQSVFDQRITEIDQSLFEAVTKDELHIKSGHNVGMNFLLRSFKGDASVDILRAVHLLEDNGWFFDILAKGYFYQVYQFVLQKKISAVKRLMLYKNEKELEEFRSIKLMHFHATTNNYSYRIMPLQAFRSLLRDNEPLPVPRDFGIYGNKYIYIAEVNQIDNLVGYYRRSPATIGKYIRFFEQCWDSPAATTLKTIDTSKTMTLEELFS